MPKVISRPSIGVNLTQAQLDALRTLHDAGIGVFVWLRLHRLTHLKFVNNGWVLYSAPDKRTISDLKALKAQPPAHYALTAQGEAIYRAFCTGYRRQDGICSRCGDRPRARGASYCRQCENARMRHYREVKAGLCRCGQPRAQSKSGRYYHQCADCHKRRTAAHYANQHAKRLAAHAAGNPILCARCKTRPCYISPSGSSSRATCAECFAAQAQQINVRQYRKRLAARLQQLLQSLGDNA